MGRNKNLIDHTIWETGGISGGVTSDASAATATLTGLDAVWIEVLSATTFSLVSGWNYSTNTSYTFTGVNIPTGVAMVAGSKIGAGYNRKIQNITHNGGQIRYYDRKDS